MIFKEVGKKSFYDSMIFENTTGHKKGRGSKFSGIGTSRNELVCYRASKPVWYKQNRKEESGG